MNDIKVVFVDIDNTLLDFNACAKECIIEVGRLMGIPLPESVMETFLPINNSLWARIEQGTLDLDGLHLIRWNMVFEALGLIGDGPAFEKRFKDKLFYSAIKVKGADEMLEYLARRYTVCAASNGPYAQQEYRLTKAGLNKYISRIFVSEKAQVSKPSPRFFDYCFDNLDGFNPQETIMIGDSLSADIKGAKDYGMTTCWFDYNQTDKSSDCADYKILSLLDIKKIL